MINTIITSKMASVILSCKTLDQLDVAITYLTLAVNAHGVAAEQQAVLAYGRKLIRYKRKMIMKRFVK